MKVAHQKFSPKRFALLCPALAVVATVALLVRTPQQDRVFYESHPGARGHLATHFAPAFTVAALLNGPVFMLGGLGVAGNDFGRTVAVATFWWWVGLTFDR